MVIANPQARDGQQRSDRPLFSDDHRELGGGGQGEDRTYRGRAHHVGSTCRCHGTPPVVLFTPDGAIAAALRFNPKRTRHTRTAR